MGLWGREVVRFDYGVDGPLGAAIRLRGLSKSNPTVRDPKNGFIYRSSSLGAS